MNGTIQIKRGGKQIPVIGGKGQAPSTQQKF